MELRQQDLILILEMRLSSLNYDLEKGTIRERANIQVRIKEIHFLLEHIKNIIKRNEGKICE